ncbi:MAG: hypothetical protein KGJ57_15780 [Sphingomonadales bacterium]|nr:hypothetical protein [Sphingomonadales bacterium]MDE2170863.1 hypothetical protein [Sphingomonadales bacterium]
MISPRIGRRALLTGMAKGTIVAGSIMPASAWATARPRPPFRAIGDLNRAGARTLLSFAQQANCTFIDPEGEIVRLLQGSAASWLSSETPIIGYTGWSDYLLAGDLARDTGRRIAQARLIGNAPARELLPPSTSSPMPALLAMLCDGCSDGGVGWIIS